MKVVKGEHLDDHPLELVFDIESGTTVTEYKEVVPDEVVQMPNYDEKDNEIEGKLEEIYAVAMANVAEIGDEMGRVEGRFKARIGEVSATMLSVALDAVRQKATLKAHKDKMTVSPGGVAGSADENGNVRADRNEILRLLIAAATKK